MISKTKIALAAAIVLSTAVSASAATTHRASHLKRSAIYNIVPNYISCLPSGGPSCSDAVCRLALLARQNQTAGDGARRLARCA